MAVTTPAPIVGLWRYPELAVRAKWSEPLDAHERGRLLARGVADRHTPDSSVAVLVAAGEYEVAEEILEAIAGIVDGPAAKRLSRMIDDDRRAAVARIAIEAHVLRDRALRIGRHDVDIAMITQSARRRRADGDAEVEALGEDLDGAEESAIKDLWDRLRARLVPDPPQPALIWADQVRALLRAKEIPAARQVLDGGPGLSSLLPVEEPTAMWPWRTVPLEEILGWFGPSGMLAPPGLREYVPDQAGEDLLQALAGLDRTPGAEAHAQLAAALAELIGTDRVPELVARPDGGFRTTLMITDDFRLPPMGFVGRDGGLPVTIGGEEPDPETADASGPAVWLATRLREERRRDRVVVTLADLLGLLQSEKPRSGRARSTSSRRMGLLRIVCQQLPVAAVIARDAFVGTPTADLRRQVWWLLHAFGVSPDGVAVDTLLFESGAHRRPLVQTLHHIVEYARANKSLRLEPEAFVQLRASAAYREAVQADLLAELGDAQAAALFTMIFFASADDPRAAIDTIVTDAGLDLPLTELLDLDAAIEGLRAAGYLVDDGPGRVALCDCGITHVLRSGDPHEVAKQALGRLAVAQTTAELGPDQERQRHEARLQDAQLLRFLAEIRWHDEHRRAERAEAAYERERGTAAERIREDRERREDRQKVDAWRSERVEIDLVEACREVARDIERYDADVDIAVRGEGRVLVVGSRAVLQTALRNIIGNAEHAVREARAPGEGTVSVLISIPPEDPARALVDVEDNGPGIAAAVLEQVARGEAPSSTRHDGDGEGIEGARVLLLLLGGELDLSPAASPALGGGHVRLRLPLRRDP